MGYGSTSAAQFQFTPLREGRLFSFIFSDNSFLNFNSRPSARGDGRDGRRGGETVDYFNSRPSARGDPRAGRGRLPSLFQFTPLREGRPARCPQLYCEVLISIHAPPRGATLSPYFVSEVVSFQFTPLREGRRSTSTGKRSTASLFQFTPLREGRLLVIIWVWAGRIFQFTPLREGRPLVLVLVLALLSISIHAPPRGATR